MARKARSAVGGVVYHVINRGNCRMKIFSKRGDFDAFVKLLREGCRRVSGMRVLGFILMDNHWHLVLWPTRDTDMAEFVGWISTTHVRRWRAHRGSEGEGHLYQGRYKSFPIKQDAHLLAVLRYVEANAVRARKVKRARHWAYCSLAMRASDNPDDAKWLSEWPVDRPAHWEAEVDRPQSEEVMEEIRTSIKRGRPFGPRVWVQNIAAKHGLEHTIRDPWRPKKTKKYPKSASK